MLHFAPALLWTSLLLASPPCQREAKLSALAAEVLSADYRGDRAALSLLDSALAELGGDPLGEYREYWRGFARWRRALNGFNETPTPADIEADLVAAIARFRAALAIRAGWIEPKIGIVGCTGSRIYLAGADEAKKNAILTEARPDFEAVTKEGGDNPRALWLMGGFQAYRGDNTKAVETLRKGLAAAWRDSTASPAPAPWAPAWGGPENLMNLAYIASHGAAPDKAVALAYAQGAATAVPSWHYVRDILLPQIQGLPDGSR
jgi:hypothetical protein